MNRDRCLKLDALLFVRGLVREDSADLKKRFDANPTSPDAPSWSQQLEQNYRLLHGYPRSDAIKIG